MLTNRKFVFAVLLLLTSFFTIVVFFKTSEYSKDIPSFLGVVEIPKDNLQNKAKIELGRKLFFDKRLSVDGTVSCATCHIPEFAFTDRLDFSEGVNGNHSQRNTPTLLNVGYHPTLMFDAHISSLEEQVIVPIQDTNEMGIKMGDLIQRLKEDIQYQNLALEIFNKEFDAWVLTRSLAAYQRTLISNNSRFDQYYYQKKENVLSEDEKEGWKIFSEKLYCIECHPAPFFTNFQAENNGVAVEGREDKGRFRIHGDSSEIGSFKVPTLRNITLTYPYMHDGRFLDLASVLEHYEKGGENQSNQSEIIQKFQLSKQEKQQLLLFFGTLVDTSNAHVY